MSPSTKKAAKKEAAPKAEAKAEKAESKKGASAKGGSAKLPESADDVGVQASSAEGEPAVDLEELEEQEAERASNAGGGNAAALAAATGTTEISASFKNFRHHPDMENFYRFIYENDLRHEALDIIDLIMVEKQTRKNVKSAKANAH